MGFLFWLIGAFINGVILTAMRISSNNNDVDLQRRVQRNAMWKPDIGFELAVITFISIGFWPISLFAMLIYFSALQLMKRMTKLG